MTQPPPYQVTDPATGEGAEIFPFAADAEVEQALAAATAAFAQWRKRPVAERAAIAKRVGELFTERASALAATRARIAERGVDVSALSDNDLQAMAMEVARRFHDDAPTTAAQAATIILDGVREDRWRILVGEDAKVLDRMVRADPEHAYDAEFFQAMAKESGWRLGA